MLHEIGHQFELPHQVAAANQVMWVHGNDGQEATYATLPLVFSKDDIDRIRNFGTGDGP